MFESQFRSFLAWLPVVRMSCIKLVSALYSLFYTMFNSAVSKRLHTGEEGVHSVGSQTYNNLISIWIIQSYRLPLLKALIAQQE